MKKLEEWKTLLYLNLHFSVFSDNFENLISKFAVESLVITPESQL